MREITMKLNLRDIEQAKEILGLADENIKALEKALPVRIVARGEEMMITGQEADVVQCEKVLQHLLELSKQRAITLSDVHYGLSLMGEVVDKKVATYLSEILLVTHRGKQVRAKTMGQYRYIQAIRERDITFGIGPAGTGKTYLAVVMAVKALKTKQVERIVLTRPAVEAGEKLGFLPGDLQEKVDPYLRPLYDGLNDVLGPEMVQKYVERQIIEVAPLAYMRGRTLDDAFIILDEAQNTSPEQMKMLLTRLGLGSKAVITGDITQIDLPKNMQSGLLTIESILSGIDEIGFCHFSGQDVARHPVVAKIIAAYEAY